MPVHDWTRVDAGIYHDFHLSWVCSLSKSLNTGLLPTDHYALIERAFPQPEPMPDVVLPPADRSLLHLLQDRPLARFHMSAEAEAYANRRNRIGIRSSRDHRLIALIDLVSPGIKKGRGGLRTFVDKTIEFLEAGIHLLIVDLFPPGPLDPQGIHAALWSEISDDQFQLPPNKSLTLVAYASGPVKEAFIEPVAVGDVLPEMPLFLEPDRYVPVPLEATYEWAWGAVPSFWRNMITGDLAP